MSRTQENAPAPDIVVYTARMRERDQASGVEVTTRIALVWTLRERKVIRLTVYQTSDEALKAVGWRTRPRRFP